MFSTKGSLSHEFNENGHIFIKGLVDKQEIKHLEKEIELVLQDLSQKELSDSERDDFSKGFLEVTNLWTRSETIRNFVHSPLLAEVAAKLLGVDGVRLHYDCILFKKPKSNSTPWHQDQVAWPLDTDNTITLWLPLNKISEKLGSLKFINGSQKFGEISLRKAIREGLKEINYGCLEIGDVTFHKGWTLHSADSNTFHETRKAFAIVYYADGARLTKPKQNIKQDFYKFFPGIEIGGYANSNLNPLLYKE
ncbi:phytanoyl-CoA dioxygenase family protein [Oceanobacillus profundus]|uniref:phytanoyl-CoA dioxygenase family protein n=1 Tax=Oceanobacillus TaxID=182709 RepID=UPI000BA704F3|nr:phytanoyl-CoA dioxygenase family protein [Oceanobacillus profundus]MCM3399745.1 phytanoyl-CoA dioxygenase family protein [Oceanobacillus profundus]MDO6450003.1 phytanoyl-CoA dioxygenase family protein [Oceanobacillus profundus]PAE28217.1 hypothetical protein CHI07_15660 [Paenibacillus sp. 7884-2]